MVPHYSGPLVTEQVSSFKIEHVEIQIHDVDTGGTAAFGKTK